MSPQATRKFRITRKGRSYTVERTADGRWVRWTENSKKQAVKKQPAKKQPAKKKVD